MNILDITANLEGVDFAPKTELLEIIQNVKTIITTVMGSIPLDRDIGVDISVLDNPVPSVARLTSSIIDAVERYEPRVKVVKVVYKGDAEGGIVRPIVRVAIR